MAVPKGFPKPPTSGRQVGTPNKRTLEIARIARTIVEDPEVQARWLRQAREGTLSSVVEQTLMYYAFGKPKDTIEGTLDVRHIVEVSLG
jgi:transposase-like protein